MLAPTRTSYRKNQLLVTLTHEHESSESSKTSIDSYDSLLQAPSPVQGNAVIQFRCMSNPRPRPKNRKGFPLGSRRGQSTHYVQIYSLYVHMPTKYMAIAHLQPIHHDDVHLLFVFLDPPHESEGVSESWLVTTLT